MSGIVGILLAAGAGRRFGGDKLLAAMPDGEPLGLKSARHLIAAGLEAVAVIRPGDARLAECMRGAGLRVVENPSAKNGIGGSIAHGIAHEPDAAGWLIALADMPWIQPITIRRVADALAAGAAIVAPTASGRRGHPVGFARDYRPQLLALRGERGASPVIDANRSRLTLIPTGDTGVLSDVDTLTDLRSGQP